jgi:hypothetical protein
MHFPIVLRLPARLILLEMGTGSADGNRITQARGMESIKVQYRKWGSVVMDYIPRYSQDVFRLRLRNEGLHSAYKRYAP